MVRPRRIVLVRHGESAGNADDTVYEREPDHALALTEKGWQQAEETGKRLREVLGRPLSHGPTQITAAEAAQLTETYRVFLDLIGDGVSLTGAGYLPPALVEHFDGRLEILEWAKLRSWSMIARARHVSDGELTEPLTA